MNQLSFVKKIIFAVLFLFAGIAASASPSLNTFSPKTLQMDSLLFILFGMILVGIAFPHKHALYFSVIGALTIFLFWEWMDPGFINWNTFLGITASKSWYC